MLASTGVTIKPKIKLTINNIKKYITTDVSSAQKYVGGSFFGKPLGSTEIIYKNLQKFKCFFAKLSLRKQKIMTN